MSSGEGCHGARHGYLRQAQRIVELQYSCDCCIETSLFTTLTCSVRQRLQETALVWPLLPCLANSSLVPSTFVDFVQLRRSQTTSYLTLPCLL